MIYGLINELDDSFHCSSVLQGFKVFDLKDIPQNLQELQDYGEVYRAWK
jgi:hypothetical protein